MQRNVEKSPRVLILVTPAYFGHLYSFPSPFYLEGLGPYGRSSFFNWSLALSYALSGAL